MSSGGPDLFVICKSCGSEVSPYITECPYCGSRLRKRAPKLDKEGRPQEGRRRQRKRPSRPSLGPLRRGEIPGIRGDARPYATIGIVAASLVLLVLVRAEVVSLADLVIVAGGFEDPSWHLLSAPFAYDNSGYAFVALFSIAVFGWLVERRHGPFAIVLLFLAGGVGGMAVASALEAFPLASGGNGVALALVVAWAMPDLLDWRRDREVDGDLLGAAAFAAVLLLLPVAVETADALAGLTGVLAGALAGLGLARSARA